MKLKLKRNPELESVLRLKGHVRAGLSWCLQAPDNGIKKSQRAYLKPLDPTRSPPLSCFQMRAEKKHKCQEREAFLSLRPCSLSLFMSTVGQHAWMEGRKGKERWTSLVSAQCGIMRSERQR